MTNGPAPLYIGRDDEGNYFNGIIDEVRILNCCLSSQDILNDNTSCYNTYKYFKRSDTILWYHFDEGTGLLTFDSSINGFTGSIIGASWFEFTYKSSNEPPEGLVTFSGIMISIIFLSIYCLKVVSSRKNKLNEI